MRAPNKELLPRDPDSSFRAAPMRFWEGEFMGPRDVAAICDERSGEVEMNSGLWHETLPFSTLPHPINLKLEKQMLLTARVSCLSKRAILDEESCSTGENKVKQGGKGAHFKEAPVLGARVETCLHFMP